MGIFSKIIDAISTVTNGSKREDQNQNWYNDDDADKENSEKLSEDLIIEEEEETLEKPVWVHPVQIQRVTSPYGWRTLLGEKVWHNGTDFSGKNELCFAPVDSFVVKILEPDSQYPYYFMWDNRQQKWVKDKKVPSGRAWTPYVVLQCSFDKSIRFVYRHLKPQVTVSQKLYAGDVVGKVDNYGYSLGAHLHFEVLLLNSKGDYKSTDPVKFLAQKLKAEQSGKIEG